jgi:hypothetical protein
VELGGPPTAVVADEGALTNGSLPVWGMAEGIPGFVANRSVLVKVRNILRQGGVVATLIDTNLGDPLHCNIFRLLESVALVSFFFCNGTTTKWGNYGRVLCAASSILHE